MQIETARIGFMLPGMQEILLFNDLPNCKVNKGIIFGKGFRIGHSTHFLGMENLISFFNPNYKM